MGKRFELLGEACRKRRPDPLRHVPFLLASSKASDRELGIQIARWSGVLSERYALAEPFLFTGLSDRSAAVILQAIYAFGRFYPLGMPATIRDAIMTFVQHPSSEIREAVAYSISGSNTRKATNALIQLAQDNDPDVRNWATFALGSEFRSDSPQLRKALYARVKDSDHEIRNEAILGLATRKDPRAYRLIRRELSLPWVSVLAVEAAAELGDSRLYPALTKLSPHWQENSDYRRAMKTCQPKKKRRR